MPDSLKFLSIAGDILLADDVEIFSTYNDEELKEKFNFRIKEVELDDDDANSPSYKLHQNKIIIKAVKKHGLLESIQKIDCLERALKKACEKPEFNGTSRMNVRLTLSELKGIREQLAEYYEISILENISSLLILSITPDKLANLITIGWKINKDRTLALVGAKKTVGESYGEKNDCEQMFFEEILALETTDKPVASPNEINSADDMSYRVRVAGIQIRRANSQYKRLLNNIQFSQIDSRIENMMAAIDLIYNPTIDPNLHSGLEYFCDFSTKILQKLPHDLAYYADIREKQQLTKKNHQAQRGQLTIM